jgi:N-acetylglucosaminyl-diphospho-decaprenol L-rhamnosyltransferase
MASSEALLDIVLVVSDGDIDHLETCLGSLQRHPLTGGDMTVNVMDNSTGTDVERLVSERFPHVRLHRFGRNVGFCVANNVGLRQTSSPFALVLNADTEFVESSLDHLVELLRSRPDIGMVGCRLVRRDGSFDHAAKRSFPTPLSALAHFTGVGRRANAPRALAQYRAPDLDEHASGDVDAVNGAFMLVRRSAMEEVGLFDEGYWFYMEDLDWCYRFKQHGWKVWYDGGTTVIHVKGGATVRLGHRSLRNNYLFHRSMARFYRKFYSGRRRLLDAAVYAAIAAKFGVSVARSSVARRRFS